MKDRHSLVGISADGQKTTLCINVGSEAEAERLAASLRTVGDYVRIEVVVEMIVERPRPWVSPPIDLEQVVQRRKELSRRRARKADDGTGPEESPSTVVARNANDSAQPESPSFSVGRKACQ